MRLITIAAFFLVGAGRARLAAPPLPSISAGSIETWNGTARASRQELANQPQATAKVKDGRDWFSDLIKQVLGITPEELIKQISVCVGGLETLTLRAAEELQLVVDRVDGANNQTLQLIINCGLATAQAALAPVQEQLRQILLHLPETKAQEPRDIVSDIIEALLGISLEELLTNINSLFTFFNQFLLDTMALLNEIASQLPEETASEIKDIVTRILFEAQHELLRPLLTSLGQLPIDEPSEPGCLSARLLKHVKSKCVLA